MNRHNHHHPMEIERLLAELEESPAPPDLAGAVMRVIETRKLPWYLRLRRWLLQPLPFGISPAWLAVTAVLAMVFFRWGATLQPQAPIPDRTALTATASVRQSDEAVTNYRIGRALLEAGQGDKALAYLEQAINDAPQTAEFHHWQGVAYWLRGDGERERQSYLAAMRNDPEVLPARLNLGHHYLERGEAHLALEQYQAVLEHDPHQPSALYNRALAYGLLGQPSQQRQALSDYLERYRIGKWAYRALEHLQDGGDYSYRAYLLGRQRVIVDSRALLDGDERERAREMQHLRRALAALSGEELHLVVYSQGNPTEAKATALALKEQLRLAAEDGTPTIRTSWFDVAEQYTDERGRKLALSRSLLLFSKPTLSPVKRNAT